MKKSYAFLLTLLCCVAMSARVDIDFSSKCTDGKNTIEALSAWGWYGVSGKNYDIEEADYIYIKYESTCDFNLILRNQDYETAYSTTCKMADNEGYIRISPLSCQYFGDIVIQNKAAGVITIERFYFCTEDEFYNPNPQDRDEALQNLKEIYQRYYPYLLSCVPGTGFGNYPEELYQAFADALEAALVLDDDVKVNDLTTEQLNAMSQAIVDTYRALMAGKIKYLPQDGYYRFVAARMFDNNTVKGLYSTSSGANGWKTLDEQDPEFIWTLQHQDDDTYLLQNAGNRLTFVKATECGDDTKYIAIDPITRPEDGYHFNWTLSTEEDVVVFNFRMSTDEEGAYKYVHANNHNSGAGEGSTMTTWCNTTGEQGASEWYLQPIDEETAREILEGSEWKYDFGTMLEDAKAKVVIANDQSRTRLINDASQFSSPYSQNDLGNRDGGSLSEGVLLDGDNSTFWHSVWEMGQPEAGVHYLQVRLEDGVEGEVEFDFARRKASDDHVTLWGIYGSNDSEGEKYDYEWICDLSTPYGERGESIKTSFSIEDGKNYEYLRFYAEETSSSRGYWHVSEFQLYQLTPNLNNQASHMGEAYTNLVKAIEEAEKVDATTITRADYEALKEAYDAFMAIFVDPTPLRQVIEQAEPALDLYVEGENPGEWTPGQDGGIAQALEEAQSYDQSGVYTQAQTDAFVEALTDAEAKLLAAANKVSPDKYYAIHFASEELYEQQGWSKGNVVSEDAGDLFDTYVCPADAETLQRTPASEVRQGSYMFFTNDLQADITFRFVPVGADTYVIQHQASGLFVEIYGYDSWTGLTLNPTLFTVEAVGHGENIIHGVNYEGKDVAYLHAQLSDHRLVTWHDHYVGSNSGLMLEEMGAVAEEGEPNSPLFDIRPGEVTTYCYPVAITPEEGQLYTVAGTFVQNEKTYVALEAVETAAPAQPVVMMYPGEYVEKDEEAEDDLRSFAVGVGTEVVTTPQNEGALVGTFVSLDLTEEAILFAEGGCRFGTEETVKVAGNRAYVVPGKVEADPAQSYRLVLEVGGTTDAIHDALARVAQTTTIYTLDGREAGRGNLGTLQNMRQGIYVINGVKVLVR